MRSLVGICVAALLTGGAVSPAAAQYYYRPQPYIYAPPPITAQPRLPPLPQQAVPLRFAAQWYVAPYRPMSPPQVIVPQSIVPESIVP